MWYINLARISRSTEKFKEHYRNNESKHEK